MRPRMVLKSLSAYYTVYLVGSGKSMVKYIEK